MAVGSQLVAQGEIDNFDACVRLVVGDAILRVLNKGVVFAANKRIEQTSLELLHLLMQHSLCSDKAMQSLETFFRFSNLRTPKSTLFGWTITIASSNERRGGGATGQWAFGQNCAPFSTAFGVKARL